MHGQSDKHPFGGGTMLRCGISVLAGILMAGAAWAAEPAWPTAPYTYVVVDQDLRSVLQQFGANLGLRVVLSDAVQGHVHGRLPELPPRQLLDHLAQTYGLDWYYDGLVLSISATSEATTKFLPLQGLSADSVRDGLNAAGVLDPRFPLRPGPAHDIMLVSGPPHYVALVQQSLSAMVADRPAPPAVTAEAPATLVIFRGSAATKVQLP